MCALWSDVNELQSEVSRLQAEVRRLKSEAQPKGGGSVLVSSKKSDSQWDLCKDGQPDTRSPHTTYAARSDEQPSKHGRHGKPTPPAISIRLLTLSPSVRGL